MAKEQMARDQMRVPTSSMLRDQIDKSGARDKIAGSDPAAAPLGTDDEAAGMPPTPQEISMAMQHERRGPAQLAQENRSHVSWWLIAAAIVVLVVFALITLI